MKTSSYSGFFKLSMEERLKEVAEFSGLTDEEQAVLISADSLDDEKADHMIENVIGLKMDQWAQDKAEEYFVRICGQVPKDQ